MSDPTWPGADLLATERLSLEPLRPDHAREMVHVLADPALYLYTGGSPPSEAELQARYTRQARGVSPDGHQAWLNWILRSRPDDRAVGFVQATLSRHGGAIHAELAWVLAPRRQGAGLASEATALAIGWLRSRGVAAFTAHIHPDNAPSAAVARRLGFVPTPVFKDGETRWEA